MRRYEVTGLITDYFTVSQIKEALKKAGAKSVNQRRAFGWSTQPMVATFIADDLDFSLNVCALARGFLPEPDQYPCMTAYAYGKEYDYQTSDECVAENIEANEYEFTEKGVIA